MYGGELEVDVWAAKPLQVRHVVRAVVSVPAQEHDGWLSLLIPDCLELGGDLAQAILHQAAELIVLLCRKALDGLALDGGVGPNLLLELHRVLLDELAGDFADLLRTAKRLGQVEHRSRAVKRLKVAHHADIGAGKPVDALGVITNCSEEGVGADCNGLEQTGPGCRGVLVFVSYNQLVG